MSELKMSKTSELGSIEPQITFMEKEQIKIFSVYNIVKSYDDLFRRAVRVKKGNLQPYLQQLANYDSREIAEYRQMLSLGEDIALKALKTGMLCNKKDKEIKKKIADFLTPEKVKVHGRPFYIQDAINCGLTVDEVDIKGNLWTNIYELYIRINSYVSTNNVAKCIECKDYSFNATVDVE